MDERRAHLVEPRRGRRRRRSGETRPQIPHIAQSVGGRPQGIFEGGKRRPCAPPRSRASALRPGPGCARRAGAQPASSTSWKSAFVSAAARAGAARAGPRRRRRAPRGHRPRRWPRWEYREKRLDEEGGRLGQRDVQEHVRAGTRRAARSKRDIAQQLDPVADPELIGPANERNVGERADTGPPEAEPARPGAFDLREGCDQKEWILSASDGSTRGDRARPSSRVPRRFADDVRPAYEREHREHNALLARERSAFAVPTTVADLPGEQSMHAVHGPYRSQHRLPARTRVGHESTGRVLPNAEHHPPPSEPGQENDHRLEGMRTEGPHDVHRTVPARTTSPCGRRPRDLRGAAQAP